MKPYDEHLLDLERACRKVQADKDLDKETKDKLVDQFLKDIAKRKDELGKRWCPAALI